MTKQIISAKLSFGFQHVISASDLISDEKTRKMTRIVFDRSLVSTNQTTEARTFDESGKRAACQRILFRCFCLPKLGSFDGDSFLVLLRQGLLLPSFFMLFAFQTAFISTMQSVFNIG